MSNHEIPEGFSFEPWEVTKHNLDCMLDDPKNGKQTVLSVICTSIDYFAHKTGMSLVEVMELITRALIVVNSLGEDE